MFTEHTPTNRIPRRLALLWLVPVLVLVSLLATAPAPLYAQAQAERSSTLLMQFRPDISAEERAATIAALGGEEIAWLAQIHVAEVRLPALAAQGAALHSASLAADAGVLFAEVDTPVVAAVLPNDPGFNDPQMRYGLDRVQAPAAWDVTFGSHEVVIAVVDSGVKLDHPAFAGRLVPGYDFVNQDAWADDDNGHGTHVAGIIAAAAGDGQGMAGLCPNCRIMPVKVLNQYNLGTWSYLAQGILFAADNGAQIINLSLGSTIPSQTLEAAVNYALAKGAILVAVAGNHGTETPFYPASLDGVLAVAATTIHDERWSRSAFGPHIDFAAPGEYIFSTYHDLNNPFGGYAYMSGTSMAAPFVSALAGLILSLEPRLDRDTVVSAMRLGADDLGAPGWDPYFGYGRINAYATLMAPVPGLQEAVGSIRPARIRLVYLPTLRN